MASTPNITPPNESSRFRSLFEVALKGYHEHTGTVLASHPLYDKLQACKSTESVIDVVKEQARTFGEYRKGDRTTQLLVTKLKPLVDTILVLNDGLGNTLGEAFKPAKYVCAGVGLLLRASKGVSESYDTLVDLFDTMSRFLERVKVYTRVEPTPSMTEIIIKLMIGLLDILGLATKEMKQGRLRAFGKKLLGSKKIEEVVKRLDRLTLEESRMSTTHILMIVHTLLEKFKGVMTNAETSTVTMEDALASIQQIVDDANKNKRDKLYEKCTKWLSPPEPFSNHSAKREQCHKGSTDWFIHGNTFGEWIVSARSFLWLHGKPGSGKSVLCSAIIDHCIHHLRRTGLGNVAFFYCDFQDIAKQSLHGILRSILVQLCQQSDSYWAILSRFYTDNKDHPPSTDALAHCLKRMLALPNEAAKYIFVDALDECPNSGMRSPRGAILSFLNEIIESRFPDVHICVTSRPEVDIGEVLERLASFRVSLEGEIGQERAIVSYVESSIELHPRMRKWSKTIKDLVVHTLKRNAHGMFRYVYCQLNELCDLPPSIIRPALEDLPKTLYETYESTLQRIPERGWKLAHRIFQCVSFSKRSLKVEEIAELLAFDFEGDTPTYHSDWRGEDAQQALLSFCPGSFLSIVGTRHGIEVRFAHFSVQEFLASTIIANSPTKISRFRLLPRPSHTLLAQICLATLLHADAAPYGRSSQNHPLYHYASLSWDEHVRFEDVALSVMDLAIRALDPTLVHSQDRLPWWKDDYAYPSRIFTLFVPHSEQTALYLAASYDLQHVVEHIARLHPGDVDRVGGDFGSPLDVASLSSHVNTVGSLLGLGANPDAPAGPNGTALQVACSQRRIDITQLLLDRGADPNAPAGRNGTALQVACLRGHIGITQLLLDRGADPNAPAGPYGTALQVTCSQMCIDITQLLLDRGADPNAPAGPNGNALQVACSQMRIDITQLLLDYGADPNAPAGPNGTTLQAACLRGHIGITQLLLDRGADPNAPAAPYGNALQAACLRGHIGITQLLLDRGADPNAPAGPYGTVLQLACHGGYVDITQLLLDCGADPNAPAGPYGTALQVACSQMRIDITQLLLDHGADPNAPAGPYGTALQAACFEGRIDITQLLLDRGADPNAPAGPYGTVLQLACRSGNVYITQLLLDRGADPNAPAGPYGTALQLACHGGHIDVTQLLLDRGADPNTSADPYGTVLQLACSEGHIDITQLLLDHGADPNASAGPYGTVLQLVCSEGHIDITQLLLDRGADPNTPAGFNGTALQAACSGRHINFTQLLLDYGADPNAPAGPYGTALYIASSVGSLGSVQLLLKHGADVSAWGGECSTALEVALRNGHTAVADLLSASR